LESSRPSSRLSRASLPIHRILPWPGLAKADMDARKDSSGAEFEQGSFHSFRPAQPRTPPDGRVQPRSPAWPATGGTVIAPMHIARASARDLDTVLGLIEDARDWLWTKDTDQWEKPWPTPSARDARVLKGLQNGKTWIVWDGAIAAATVTIATAHNPAVWSKPTCTCDLTERAVYVHRLITARKYAGCGLGAELIDWAGLRGRRKNRARWIRIDVWSTNTGLHDYYVSKGFKPCGQCADPDYPSGALFEKPVAEIVVPRFPKFTETSGDSQLTEPIVNVEETAKFNLAAI
jgi:GNAT superfamily N-acetyltransferase